MANGGLYFRQMNLHIYIGFLHGASIITMERGFYSLKSFFTELQISLLLELLLYSVYFSHLGGSIWFILLLEGFSYGEECL